MNHFWLVILIGTLSSSCKDYNDHAGKPYKALVIYLDHVDADGKPSFKLGEKTFNYLSNFDELDGTYFKIKRGGEFKVKEVKGSIVSPDSFSGGSSPDLRYFLKDGVAVPRDYATLAQVSAFYQFDLIVSALEETTGISLDAFFGDFEEGKIDVFFEPVISIITDEISASAVIKLNAAYVPGQHQFLLFQRSAIEDIPLSSNLQVLSHEFGHALFDYAFSHNDKEESRYSREYAISGLNEGWADFISYRFTGSGDVLRSSIDIALIADERNFFEVDFEYEDLTPSLNVNGKICGGSFYCIGTLFAKSLVTAMEAMEGSVSARDFTIAVVAALREAKETIDGLPSKIFPVDLSEEYEDLEKLTTEAFLYNGEVLGAFFNGLLSHLDEDKRTTLCKKLILNFGDLGFPKAARNDVCSE